MQQQDLVGYIKAEIGKGTPRMDITNSLHANGWSFRDIEDAYTRALAQLSAPAPSPYRNTLFFVVLLLILIGTLFLIRLI